MTIADLKPDCRHFRGHIPCKPHKETGAHCPACAAYDPVDFRILIIKLGAIGDVIRSTPLLHRLKKEYPRSEIYWLTYSPEVIPSVVDHVLLFRSEDVEFLLSSRFDLLLNLDKDREACALASRISAARKKGFLLRDTHPWPADRDAEEKFLTGLFDDISRADSKSYLQELFEMCGYPFQGEPYILELPPGEFVWEIDRSRPVIGLNTGCGKRWKSRLWPEKNWISLAIQLLQMGYEVVLLGGPEEHEKNLRISEKSGAKYWGHFPLNQFIHEVNQCDLIVTAVTMAMHLAIGLKKKLILFNNTFNRNEFELYGLGEILEPDFDCECYYAQECPNDCMQYLSVSRVMEACSNWLPLES